MIVPVFDELKALVKLTGLSSAHVAREAGVCGKTVQQWVNGEVRMPRIETMLKVAAFLERHMELTPTIRKMVRFYGNDDARRTS